MPNTIQISEKVAALLSRQASQLGVSMEACVEARVEVWLEELQKEVAAKKGAPTRAKARAAAEGILRLQKEVKPDPEGWTTRDYIQNGRR